MINEVVSVIIPVYNCERFIKKCLESVLNQSYSLLEIIIVDDGSNDRSGRLIDELMSGEKRAKIFHQDNKGVSAARNVGLVHATGKYLMFLDGDDYLGNQYIEQLVEVAMQSNAELVICGYQKVAENGKVLSKVIPGIYIPGEHEEWACRITAICSRLYRKELWDKYNIKFELGVRGEDVPISLFFNAVCKNIKILQVAEYYYVQHEESATHNFRGLQNFRLPYKTIKGVLEILKGMDETYNKEFLELGFMRFFTQCIFDLGWGAEKLQLYELCDFIEKIMAEYFPLYWENTKASVWSDLDIPFINKVEVKVFMILIRFNLLYTVAEIIKKHN